MSRCLVVGPASHRACTPHAFCRRWSIRAGNTPSQCTRGSDERPVEMCARRVRIPVRVSTPAAADSHALSCSLTHAAQQRISYSLSGGHMPMLTGAIEDSGGLVVPSPPPPQGRRYRWHKRCDMQGAYLPSRVTHAVASPGTGPYVDARTCDGQGQGAGSSADTGGGHHALTTGRHDVPLADSQVSPYVLKISRERSRPCAWRTTACVAHTKCRTRTQT